ncbi:MAG: phenol hydroxylase subunit P4 [Burkholderiaceae bacterium]|jgi:phenol hydroxylase P4 protein|nr:phenol hydroxylase subunit P4 [Burkholderiaceae bacterium]
MPVTSTKPYVGVARDLVGNFLGKQIVYVCWDQHLLFAAPMMLVVEPTMLLKDLLDQVWKPLLGADPDVAALKWEQAQWLKSNRPWKPRLEASIADNGIDHKEQLRLRTPELNSLRAAA